MSMQLEVATHQALTPKHRRRRALAAALHNAPAQEGSLLLAALCSAASGQRCTRRTHGVLSEPKIMARRARTPENEACELGVALISWGTCWKSWGQSWVTDEQTNAELPWVRAWDH